MSGGQMQGLTGCNVMTGAYNRQNEKMQFIQVKGTNSVCPEVQPMERKLIVALQQLRSWRLTSNDHHLQFLSEKGEVLAEFVALSP
jgi:heat shock protein HslJ